LRVLPILTSGRQSVLYRSVDINKEFNTALNKKT
jgi:hypothetical protein